MMGNYGERLPYASTSGDAVDFHFDDPTWRELEAALGKAICDDARGAFLELCIDYVERDRLEAAAVKKSDLVKHARKLAGSFQPFFAFAFGQRSEDLSLEAWEEFESHFTMLIGTERFEHREQDAESSYVRPPLSRNNLAEMAIRVSAALERMSKGDVSDQLFEGHEGLKVGTTLNDFLGRARGWAKENKFPRSLWDSANGDAGRLPRFLHIAIGKMPENGGQSLETPEALASRMKKNAL